jgi:hypothetical protein
VIVEKGRSYLIPFKGEVQRPTEGENMRIALNIVGAVLVFFGGVWVLQGVNVLPGSFMSGQMQWAVRGGIAVVAGIALLVWANRKRQAAATKV